MKDNGKPMGNIHHGALGPGRDSGVEHGLRQDVPQFFADGPFVSGFGRLQCLVGLLEQVQRERQRPACMMAASAARRVAWAQLARAVRGASTNCPMMPRVGQRVPIGVLRG